jgi:Protein of unknown function (DUF3530)
MRFSTSCRLIIAPLCAFAVALSATAGNDFDAKSGAAKPSADADAASAAKAPAGKDAATSAKETATSTPPRIGVAPQQLAAALQAEMRMLRAGDQEFAIYVQSKTAGEERGTLVLLPGDGSFPTVPRGIDRLRKELRGFGWNTMLVALDAPPSVSASRLHDASTSDSQQEADKSTPDASTAGKTPSDGQAKELQQWADACVARTATAVMEARKTGPVVLVAEDTTAVLLRRYMATADAPASLSAALLIEPLDHSGIDAGWPRGLSTPVMEILTPAQREQVGDTLAQRARGAGLRSYRQVMMPTGSLANRRESPLTRTVRGWLGKLPLPAKEEKKAEDAEVASQ